MADSKGRILCADDDPDTRELLSFILQDEGYDVVCAENAKDVLNLAKPEAFDLYILDNWLHEERGVTVTSGIRQIDSKTPILFYSGAAYDEDKENARIAGAQGYLVKPVTHDVLLIEVNTLISNGKIAANSQHEHPDS